MFHVRKLPRVFKYENIFRVASAGADTPKTCATVHWVINDFCETLRLSRPNVPAASNAFGIRR
jgi:hypothetical protein